MLGHIGETKESLEQNLTFCDIGFSGIKKMPFIYIFSVIIIDFSLSFTIKWLSDTLFSL